MSDYLRNLQRQEVTDATQLKPYVQPKEAPPVEAEVDIETRRANQEAQDKFKAENIQLPNGEWVNKSEYDVLPDTFKEVLNTQGISGYNAFIEAEQKKIDLDRTEYEKALIKFNEYSDKDAGLASMGLPTAYYPALVEAYDWEGKITNKYSLVLGMPPTGGYGNYINIPNPDGNPNLYLKQSAFSVFQLNKELLEGWKVRLAGTTWFPGGAYRDDVMVTQPGGKQFVISLNDAIGQWQDNKEIKAPEIVNIPQAKSIKDQIGEYGTNWRYVDDFNREKTYEWWEYKYIGFNYDGKDYVIPEDLAPKAITLLSRKDPDIRISGDYVSYKDKDGKVKLGSINDAYADIMTDFKWKPVPTNCPTCCTSVWNVYTGPARVMGGTWGDTPQTLAQQMMGGGLVRYMVNDQTGQRPATPDEIHQQQSEALQQLSPAQYKEFEKELGILKDIKKQGLDPISTRQSQLKAEYITKYDTPTAVAQLQEPRSELKVIEIKEDAPLKFNKVDDIVEENKAQGDNSKLITLPNGDIEIVPMKAYLDIPDKFKSGVDSLGYNWYLNTYVKQAENEISPYKKADGYDIAEYLKVNPNKQETLKIAGFSDEAIIKAEKYNTVEQVRDGILKRLEPYKSDEGYDIAKYMRDNNSDGGILVIAGFDSKSIEAAGVENNKDYVRTSKLENIWAKIQNETKYDDLNRLLYPATDFGITWNKFQKEYPELAKELKAEKLNIVAISKGKDTNPNMSLDQFTAEYAMARGLEPITQSDIFSLFDKDKNNIKALAGLRYQELYGENASIKSAGISAGAVLLSPVRVLHPEVTLKDIMPLEWGIGAAQIATIVLAPGIAAVGGKVGSVALSKGIPSLINLASGGIFVASTAEQIANTKEWDNVAIAEVAVSVAIDTLIIGSAFKGLMKGGAKTTKTIENVSKITESKAVKPILRDITKALETKDVQLLKLSATRLEAEGKSIPKNLGGEAIVNKAKTIKESPQEFINLNKTEPLTFEEDFKGWLKNKPKYEPAKPIDIDKTGKFKTWKWENEKITFKEAQDVNLVKGKANTIQEYQDDIKGWLDEQPKTPKRYSKWLKEKPEPTPKVKEQPKVKDFEEKLEKWMNDEPKVTKKPIEPKPKPPDKSTKKIEDIPERIKENDNFVQRVKEYQDYARSKESKTELEPQRQLKPEPKQRPTKLKEATDINFDKLLEEVEKSKLSPEELLELQKLKEKLRPKPIKQTRKLEGVKEKTETRPSPIPETYPEGQDITWAVGGEDSRGFVDKQGVYKTWVWQDGKLVYREAPNIELVKVKVGGKTKVQIRTKTKTQTEGETETQTQTETQTETKPDTKTETKTDTETKTETQTQTKTEPATETQPETRPETQPVTKTATETKTETKTDTKPEPKTEPSPITKPVPDTKPAPKTKDKTDTKTITDTVPVPDTKPVPFVPPPPPKIPVPPKPPKPPPPKLKIKFKSGKVIELSKEQIDGAVAWKQGVMYKMFVPGTENGYQLINTPNPIPGVKIEKGYGSAMRSIVLKHGDLPKDIKWDMGIMDIEISNTRKGHKPKIKFTEDKYSKTRTTKNITKVKIGR